MRDTCEAAPAQVSLEAGVARRKRSLVAVVSRRLVRSCHELEVCTQPRQEDTAAVLEAAPRRRRSVGFSSTRDIKLLYCSDPAITSDRRTQLLRSRLCSESIFYECNSRYNTLV